jgi:hypothetical protein
MDTSLWEERVLRGEKPGLYERLGLWYFSRLSARDMGRDRVNPVAVDDKELAYASRNITALGFIVAFVIGGISAGGSVYTELMFEHSDIVTRYSWLIGVTVLLTVIEFAVLFWISIRTVFFISRITGHNRLEDDNLLLKAFIPNLLARAALEIPDPVMHILGIDPLARVSKKKLLLIGIMYKLKVTISNVLAKLFLRRVVGKSILRVSVAYVSVLITGLWNALVLFKVARDARLRLFGNLIAKHIVEKIFTPEKLERLSPRARVGCIQAVGNSVVIAQRYHPNMVILLMRLSSYLNITGGDDYGRWEAFLSTLCAVSNEEKYFLLDLLCIATAFDGKVSRLEKRLLHQAFGEYTDIYFQRIYALKNLMLKGRLHKAIDLCGLDFEPG